MKVYLDMCSIQRPLDCQDDVRVATEAQAVLGVLRLCESGQVTLIASDALLFELERNPHPVRKTTPRRSYRGRGYSSQQISASKPVRVGSRRAG